MKAVVSVLKWMAAQLLWRLFQIVLFIVLALQLGQLSPENMIPVYVASFIGTFFGTILVSRLVNAVRVRRRQRLGDSEQFAATGMPLVQFDKEIPGVTTLEGERIGNGFRVR